MEVSVWPLLSFTFSLLETTNLRKRICSPTTNISLKKPRKFLDTLICSFLFVYEGARGTRRQMDFKFLTSHLLTSYWSAPITCDPGSVMMSRESNMIAVVLTWHPYAKDQRSSTKYLLIGWLFYISAKKWWKTFSIFSIFCWIEELTDENEVTTRKAKGECYSTVSYLFNVSLFRLFSRNNARIWLIPCRGRYDSLYTHAYNSIPLIFNRKILEKYTLSCTRSIKQSIARSSDNSVPTTPLHLSMPDWWCPVSRRLVASEIREWAW